MAMQLGRSIRHCVCAKYFSPLPKSRPFVAANSSGSLPPPPNPALLTVFRKALNASGVPLLGTWMYWWDVGYVRTSYEEWRGKMMAQAILKKIDRKKYESKEAYLKMLGSEISALEAEILFNRTENKRSKEAVKARLARG